VKFLQQMLNELQSGASVPVTGAFTGETDLAVRNVQRQLGISVDGKFGQDTVKAILGNAKVGASSSKPQVRALQFKVGVAADGIYGADTARAAVGAGGGTAAKPIIIPAGARTEFNLSPNFRAMQFIDSPTARAQRIDNWPSDPVIFQRLAGLCKHILEPLQQHYGRKITINSGYRCHKLNRAVGSKTDKSNHLFGYAADIEIPGISNQTLAQWVRDNMVYRELLLEFHHAGAPSSG
jgi:zinc D-Ala-D-Ala carboxypeptidase